MAPSENLNDTEPAHAAGPGLLPLNALRAFEAAARRGSLAAAARELGVTPGAVSQQIRLLEDVLKTRLLERTGQGVLLTVEAADAAPFLHEAFASLAEASARLRQAGAAPARVRLGAPGAFAAAWLAPRLSSGGHGDVSLISDPGPDDLDRFRLDIEIRFGDGQWPGYGVRPLLSDSVMPALSPDLFEACGRDWRRAVTELPLIHDTSMPRDPAQPDWQAWLDRNGLKRAGMAQGDHVSAPDHAVRAAIAGRGVALVRASLAEGAVSEGRLVTLIAGGVTPLNWRYHLLVPEGRPLSRAARALTVQLAEAARPFETAGV
ncbi:MAG: LysR substrate-binding domain-containing protein [Caulobacterales bacterium]|uniref:LysR substrate-binding domain-containing protein n=1 Tax=Glycocaulis sp. TaxID=1969725 RepID=UPI003FA15C3A